MPYNVYDLTIEQLTELIRSGDDSHHNQIRIRTDGDIFLSSIVGADNLSGIGGRFETFDAGNGYVGPAAAARIDFIERLYVAIQKWKDSPHSYIDIF